MALDTENKRVALLSYCQPQNPSLPEPDNELDAQDRAQLLQLARNLQEEVLNKAKRLAFLQFGQAPILTFPDPDGSFDVNDRRHILSSTRFEGVIISVPSTNLTFTSEAPTLSWVNHEIFVPSGDLTASSQAPTPTPDWVANDWFNPFWVLPLADFSSRQGAWWGPSDVATTVEIPSGDVSLTSEAPSLVLEVGFEIFIPSADLVLDSPSPGLLIGVHQVVTPASGDVVLSSQPPVLYVESADEIVLPSSDLTITSEAPAVQYYPDHRFEPITRALTLSTEAPTVTTRNSLLEIPSADLTLSSDAPIAPIIIGAPATPAGQEGVSTGGRYGRPFVVPPKKKKQKPLPEGPGIAAVRLGDNVLVSRAPNVRVFSPPVTLTDTLRMIKKMDRDLTETKKALTAEILSFREAVEAREERKAKEAKEAEIKKLEAKKAELEQQIAENQELMTGLLLLMVE